MNNCTERPQNWPRMYLALVFYILLSSLGSNTYADNQSLNDESYPLGTIQNPINLLMVVYNSPMVPWTQAMQNGFIKGVNETDLVVNVFTESIYASITADEKLSLDLSTLFTGKYKHIKFHGMYTESTDANKHIDIFRSFKNDLNIPIYAFEYNEDITGKGFIKTSYQDELNLLESNARIIALQRPKLETLHVIRGANINLDFYQTELTSFLQTYSPGVKVSEVEYSSLATLQQQIAQIPASDAIMYFPVFYQEGQERFTPREFIKEIQGYSQTPIYTMWHSLFSDAVVGGTMIDAEAIGKNAVFTLLTAIDTGRFPRSMDIGVTVFDYQQLRDYHLPIPDFIEDVEVANVPGSIWVDYPHEIIVILLITLILLSFSFIYRQKVLKDAYAKANYLAQAKSKFLENVSHEIRTPINGILGAIPLIKNYPLTNEQQQYLHLVEFSSDVLLSNMNDILEYSKIESNTYYLEPVSFSPKTLIDGAFTYAKMINAKHDIELILIDNKLIDVPLYGDARRLKQVILNVLNNAVKYTERGSIVLQAEIAMKDGKYCLNISVTDTGVGISQDLQNKVFEPFSQFNQNNEAIGGTGLGLSLSKAFVKLMSGKISLTSRLGQGTTVEFECPFELSAEPILSEVTASAETNKAMTENKRVRDPRILIVEDNEINQTILLAQLEKIYPYCHVVENGQLCLEALKATPDYYDLIIMDIKMPVMSGDVAAKHIRLGHCGERNKQLPIVALTAHIAPDGEYANVFNEQLTKPTPADMIIKTVQKYLILH
ncbi:ATP-binding protein [Opacimonas viscosa]|uniref:histidine kinase n=1 Tax=Opacimonas viscosa TaxID=2961944 RepID=A0AA41X2L7_9ALTE|nr:ATP-binding protein [Opacimonas viscosa]MCP3428732.1 ATP-binding protein [Opacimonas viscosa]